MYAFGQLAFAFCVINFLFSGATRFSLFFKTCPAFRCIFFVDFGSAQSPKKDAAAIGAKSSVVFLSKVFSVK